MDVPLSTLFGPDTEYDDFQKQRSEASVDFGSVESGPTSPVAVNKRSSAKRVERPAAGLDRISEAQEASGGTRPGSPAVSSSARTKSPSKSRSKRDSGSRSPDRYPVTVVDPSAGRLPKARSSGDVFNSRHTVGNTVMDGNDSSRARRGPSTLQNSPNPQDRPILDNSHYQPDTVGSYISTGGPMSFGDVDMASSLGLIDRPLVLDGSPTSFAHNALLRGVPLSPNDISPRIDESSSLSTSSVFSQSKPGSMSPEQRVPRSSRSGGAQLRSSGHTAGASSAHSTNSAFSAPINGSSPHSPHLYSQQHPIHVAPSQPSSAAQRLIDSKLSGPDHFGFGALAPVYEPSASESERDNPSTKNRSLGGVSPVLSSMLAPADEFHIQPVSQSLSQSLLSQLSISDASGHYSGSSTVTSASSSGGIAAHHIGASDAGYNANGGQSSVSGKRTRYSSSNARRSESISLPPGATTSTSSQAGRELSHSGAFSPTSGGAGSFTNLNGIHHVTTVSHTSPDIPRRSRSLTSESLNRSESNLPGYPEGQQYALLPQSDRPIPIITSRSHSMYSGGHHNTQVHDGGSTSPQSRRQQRRTGAYSAEGVLISPLQQSDCDAGSNASSMSSSTTGEEILRGRTMSTRSGARSSRSTSPMAYIGESRLLQNTAARTPAPLLEDYFLIEDASAHYKLLEKLGKGSFGNVYIAKERKDKTGKRYAIKKSLIDSKRRAQTICREIGNLRNSDHTNVVKFIGSYYHKDVAWIIMEYLDAGTLRDLRSCTTLKEEHIAYIMREVLKGLEYMHVNGTMHRDIKGENILLSSKGEVKIADLGLAVPAQEDQKRIAGSKYWMAPEMILAAGYGPKADIYSLGCTAYELADGLPPYAQYSAIRALYCAAKHGFPPLDNPQSWSKDFLNFLATCTHPNPRDRPTCDVLLQHPFIEKACSKSAFAKLIASAFASDDYSGFLV